VAGYVILHRPGRPPERVGLSAPLAAGGGPDDAVRLDGAPRAALLLEPSPDGAVAEVRAPGVRLAGRQIAPGLCRLLRPGEAIEIHGHAVEVPAPPASEGTRSLAAALLGDAAAGGRPAAGRHLLVLEGRDAGRRIPLAPSQTLGRGRGADVRIDDDRVSRLHVRLVVEGGALRLEDLGSKNGVRLNAAFAGRGPVALRHGDEIALGETRLALVEPFAGPAADPGERRPPVRPAWTALAVAGGLLALCAVALALAAA
jgi:Inner membrane component of T3SS, cytoplasmic domain